MPTTTVNPMTRLDIAGDYSVVLWLEVDGLPDEPLRLVVEMKRRGATWSLTTAEYRDDATLRPEGIGPAVVVVTGIDGDPLTRLRAFLAGELA